MTTPSFSSYHPRTHLSVSSLVNFARCPRRFFYSSGCRLGLEEHLALKFGEAMHAALPHAYHGHIDLAFASFIKVWQDRDKGGDQLRNVQHATKLLARFADSHRDERSIYHLAERPLNAPRIEDEVSPWEVPFALDIGLSVPLVGRIDAMATHRDTGEPWVLEWKTSREVSSRLFDNFTLSPQVLAYTLAARSYGVPVRGAMVEIIPVQKASIDSSLQPIHVADHHLEDFVRWARWVGEQILSCERAQEFPKDLSACSSYPGFGSPGYVCEYQQLCLVPDWSTLAGMYTTRDDRPFILLGPTHNGNPIGQGTAQPTVALGEARGPSRAEPPTALPSPPTSPEPTHPSVPPPAGGPTLRPNHSPSRRAGTLRIGR